MSAARSGVRLRPILFYPWLLLLLGPAIAVVQGGTHPAWVAGAGLLLLAAAFLCAVHLALGGGGLRPAALGALAVLAVLTVTLTFTGGQPMIRAFYLVAMAAGVVLAPGPERLGPLASLVVATAAASTAWLTHAGDVFGAWYVTLLSGLLAGGFVKLVATVNELGAARDELARAAVAEERLRFARDLHDLLGHTLSVIVVKAEAVRRLHERAPEVARQQAVDIETIGRQALTEIREAVTGYRVTTLRDELAGARAALAGAGIEVTVRHPGPPPPPPVEALLAWSVREGTTNVLRHSGAGHCDIRIATTGGAVTLEIVDDGAGCAGAAAGNGLRGLAERLDAVRGTVELVPAAGGGSRLAVRLPCAAEPAEEGETR
ncbi:histidine kinase [Actinoplanes oblitus]|uniref:Histidine kinase n=1 Tax=Actinoplanes oblitus TaxID=3040509 RepID=A0ABY8WRX9_9ACTN|nr:histidine kinase [Actinoplanes oblitus]WIM99751.1 histidine kinase [Actinoplanes oblitus]